MTIKKSEKPLNNFKMTEAVCKSVWLKFCIDRDESGMSQILTSCR